MVLNPEAQILVINAGLLLVAYKLVYPSIRGITPGRMMKIDVVISGLALAIAGALFWGEGIGFSMLLFPVNWAVFSILTMAVMEMPLFIWFCRERGMDPFPVGDMGDMDDDDR